MEDRSVSQVTNGVSNVSLDDRNEESMNTDVIDLSGLPSVLIVTNIDESVFDVAENKNEFENVFKRFDPEAKFNYLKSFRRARIEFKCPLFAARTKVHLHETEVNGKKIKCYFSQPLESEDESTSQHLHPPAPTKQFLISPPASPPVGWEPIQEAQPVINYDLLSALAGLSPGEAHELHPPSNDHPSIVVHICENPTGFDQRPSKIQQTKRPD